MFWYELWWGKAGCHHHNSTSYQRCVCWPDFLVLCGLCGAEPHPWSTECKLTLKIHIRSSLWWEWLKFPMFLRNLAEQANNRLALWLWGCGWNDESTENRRGAMIGIGSMMQRPASDWNQPFQIFCTEARWEEITKKGEGWGVTYPWTPTYFVLVCLVYGYMDHIQHSCNGK